MNNASSLDTLINEDSEGGYTLAEIIEDEAAVIPFESIEDKAEREHIGQEMRKALDKCSEAERELVIDYYYNGKPLTWIAAEKGVTHQAIANTRRKALAHLRRTSEIRNLWRELQNSYIIKSNNTEKIAIDRVYYEEFERPYLEKMKEAESGNAAEDKHE